MGRCSAPSAVKAAQGGCRGFPKTLEVLIQSAPAASLPFSHTCASQHAHHQMDKPACGRTITIRETSLRSTNQELSYPTDTQPDERCVYVKASMALCTC
ncbi:unnamed protein product [Urochloa humidicola]